MKISKYMVISEPNLAKFQQEVQQAIEDNWQPHGSLQVTNENHMIWYSQSMVQYVSAAVSQKKLSPVLSQPRTADPVPKPPAAAPPLAEIPPPTRPPARSKPVAPVVPLAPFPSAAPLETTAAKPSPSVSSRPKVSHRLRQEPKAAILNPPLSTALPFPASANFSPQFLWASNKRYTIFDAVELPGGIAQLSCTVAEGDFEKLTLSVGKEAELDEKGRVTAKTRIRSVSRRGAMAVIEVSL